MIGSGLVVLGAGAGLGALAALLARLLAGRWRRWCWLAGPVAGALLALSALAAAVPAAILAPSALLATFLVALALVDLLEFRLPDLLTLPLLAAGLAFAALMVPDALPAHTLAALAGYGVLAGIGVLFRRLSGHDGLGLGDAKLLAAGGAWLGPAALPSVLLLGSLLALAGVGLRGRAALREPIPFGPALCLGLWLVWLNGPLIAY